MIENCRLLTKNGNVIWFIQNQYANVNIPACVPKVVCGVFGLTALFEVLYCGYCATIVGVEGCLVS